jgi:hypothetical protein
MPQTYMVSKDLDKEFEAAPLAFPRLLPSATGQPSPQSVVAASPATKGIYLGGGQSYTETKGLERQTDTEMKDVEVVRKKKH